MRFVRREFAHPREIFDAQTAGLALCADCEDDRRSSDWFSSTPFIFFDIDGSLRGIDYWERKLADGALRRRRRRRGADRLIPVVCPADNH